MSRATLRPYQAEMKARINQAWAAGDQNVLAVLPTGAGKTVLFSDVIHDHAGTAWAIAHRQELVGQISMALAQDGVSHRIIGPQNVVKMCVTAQMQKLGTSFIDPRAKTAVVGVDTLVRRLKDTAVQKEARAVTLWVMDEAHHLLRSNKWGKAVEALPNAKGLGVTATPVRADGQGLGSHADGVFDDMLVGPSMRDLIDAGYLTDYRIYAPPTDFIRPEDVGSSGDFTRQAMSNAVANSHIVGDVVKHYLRLAPGKLGVTFVPDVATAHRVAESFNAAGVPAEVVEAKTPDAERAAALGRFRNRQTRQLVNVDLFGEGFDLPAIEVVSFARPTESFSLFVQQFGRVLRLMIDPALQARWGTFTDEQRKAHIAQSGKPYGIIIDHVGNVENHAMKRGLPDSSQRWSLDAAEKRRSGPTPGAVPQWSCPICTGSWPKIYTECQAPGCDGQMPEPSSRAEPKFVDGDLTELTPDALARLRAAVAEVDRPAAEYQASLAAKRVPGIGQMANVKRHVQRQQAQEALRGAIAWWAGYQRAQGRDDSESYRRFYFQFGVDVMTAQTLKPDEAIKLAEDVTFKLMELNR